jgi:hypothetical protein
MNYSPERLIKILSMDSGYSKSFEYPIISLPDNNTYWSDGWDSYNNIYNNNNYNTTNNFIYPKIYSMLSKSTNDLRKQKSFDCDDINNNFEISIDESNNNNSEELVILANDESVLVSIENLKNDLLSNKNTIMDKVCRIFIEHVDY